MQNNLVSVIIVNYNQKVYLTNCLESLYENIKSHPFEVILVNNSPGEPVNNFKEHFSNLSIIENKNTGFSKANNLGAKYAKGEYLLFLNPDTIVNSDFIPGVLKFFNDSGCAIAGLGLQNEDGTFQVSFGCEINFFNEFRNKKLERISGKQNPGIEKLKAEYSVIKEINWVSGAAVLIREKIFREINGFDGRFFLYYEDADICKRARDRGYKIYYFPDAGIIHLKGENINKNFAKSTYYFAKRSQILYYKIHHKSGQRALLMIYLFFKFFILAILTWKSIYFRILGLIIFPFKKNIT